MNQHRIPVITIDGPTASGKGTVAQQVAHALEFHYLDSGALYRLTALSALRRGIDVDDEAGLMRLAQRLPCRFVGEQVWLGEDDVSIEIRAELIGNSASKIAALPGLRSALVDLQLGFERAPGLVADGRDMGTVIFPDAPLKVFLTASVERRAERRYKQLISKGFSANMHDLSADLRARDSRDMNRSSAPLKPAEGAYFLDTSELTVAQAVHQVLSWYATT